MTHSPTCQRLLIVVTKGYSHTVYRCDECGAISTTRHGTTSNPQPKKES